MAGTSQLATPVAARLCLLHGGSSTCARKGSKARLDVRCRGAFAFGAAFAGRCSVAAFSVLDSAVGSAGRQCRARRRRSPVASTVASSPQPWRADASAGAHRAADAGAEPSASLRHVAGAPVVLGTAAFSAGVAGSSPRAVVSGSLARRRWRASRNAGGAVWLLAFTFVHSCSTFVNIRNS